MKEKIQSAQDAGASGNTLDEDIQLLRNYAEAMGGMHDEDCSLDDTCHCSGKPINDAVNRICNSSGASGNTEELVEALEQIRDLDRRKFREAWDMLQEIYRIANAAIRKAKGIDAALANHGASAGTPKEE